MLNLEKIYSLLVLRNALPFSILASSCTRNVYSVFCSMEFSTSKKQKTVYRETHGGALDGGNASVNVKWTNVILPSLASRLTHVNDEWSTTKDGGSGDQLPEARLSLYEARCFPEHPSELVSMTTHFFRLHTRITSVFSVRHSKRKKRRIGVFVNSTFFFFCKEKDISKLFTCLQCMKLCIYVLGEMCLCLR